MRETWGKTYMCRNDIYEDLIGQELPVSQLDIISNNMIILDSDIQKNEYMFIFHFPQTFLFWS